MVERAGGGATWRLASQTRLTIVSDLGSPASTTTGQWPPSREHCAWQSTFMIMCDGEVVQGVDVLTEGRQVFTRGDSERITVSAPAGMFVAVDRASVVGGLTPLVKVKAHDPRSSPGKAPNEKPTGGNRMQSCGAMAAAAVIEPRSASRPASISAKQPSPSSEPPATTWSRPAPRLT